MTRLFIFLFMICFISCKNESIEKIVVKSVNPRYETPIKIYPETFEWAFHDRIVVDTIKDKKFLRKFYNLVSSLKVDTGNYYSDVRYKIEIYKNNDVDVLCGDGYNYILNSRPMTPSDELEKVINEILIKRYPKDK
ncbi:MAG: hypothetical protein AB9846_13915 [Tenuifilaceae bacterium]